MTVLNIEIEQGSSWELTHQQLQSNGLPVNLTGCILRGQIRELPSNPLAIASITCVLDSDPRSGKFTLSLNEATTKQFTFKTAYYDIECVDATNKVTKLLKGKIILNPEITK